MNTLKNGVYMTHPIKCRLICALDGPPQPVRGGYSLPKEGRMHQNSLLHCIHMKNSIDLLPGSRNNGYKLVYGGLGRYFLFPQRNVGYYLWWL